MESNIAFLKEQQAYRAFDALFEKIKQWGVTPFANIEHVEDVINEEAGNTPQGATDYVVYDDSVTQKRFYLKRVNKMAGVLEYYSSWPHESMDLFHDPNTSLVYKDRCFMCPTSFIICGQVFEFNVNNFNSLVTTVNETGATYFAAIDKGDFKPVTGNKQYEGDVIYSPAAKTFFLKVKSGSTTTYYINWNGDDKYNSTSQIKARTDRFFVSPNGYIINGQMFEADTSNITALILALQSTVNTHTQELIDIKNAIGKSTTTHFEGAVTNVSIRPVSAETMQDGDKIYYFTNGNYFVLRRGSNYYSTWEGDSAYNTNDDGTIKANVEKFYISPQGYVIDGTMVFWNLDDIKTRLTDAETNITGLQNNKADQTALDSLRQAFEEYRDNHMLLFDGIIKEALDSPPDRTTNSNPSDGDVDRVIYYIPWSAFILERTRYNGDVLYYSKWRNFNNYNYIDEDNAVQTRKDVFFVSPEGYVVNGILNSVDLQPVFNELALKADTSYVNTELAKKVNSSSYLQDLLVINDKINEKAPQSAVDALGLLVARKAEKSVVDDLAKEVEKKVDTDAFTDAMETWAAAYTDLNERVAQNLKRAIVNTLPDTNPDEHTIYMVKVDSEGDDYYVEYIWDTSNQRYERIGSTKIDLTGVTTDADLNRYVAANNGIEVTFNTVEKVIPITLKPGDKWKVVYMGGNKAATYTYAYNVGGQTMQVANPLTLGEEYVVGANETITNISLAIHKSTSNPPSVRLFLVDSNLGYNFVTDADIDNYFAELDTKWKRTIN